MNTIITVVAAVLGPIGLGLAYHNTRSLILWLWTLSRPTDEIPEIKAGWDVGPWYRGEMSRSLVVSEFKSGECVRCEQMAPHTQLYAWSRIKEGIKNDLIQITIGVTLVVTMVLLFATWGARPGGWTAALLCAFGFFLWLYGKAIVYEHDPEVSLRQFFIGLSNGGGIMMYLGLIAGMLAAAGV